MSATTFMSNVHWPIWGEQLTILSYCCVNSTTAADVDKCQAPKANNTTPTVPNNPTMSVGLRM